MNDLDQIPIGKTVYLCLLTKEGEVKAPEYHRVPVKFRRRKNGDLIATNRKKPYTFPVVTSPGKWGTLTEWGIALNETDPPNFTGRVECFYGFLTGVSAALYPNMVIVRGER